jgi:cytochrome oxidase Cu insertion factor (SCO1/SenC/PrrC family)
LIGAVIAIAIVAFVVLIAGGAIAYFAFVRDKKSEPAVAKVPAGGPAVKAQVGGQGGRGNPGGAPTGPRVVGLAVGNLAPDIENEDLDGETFKLSDYRGKVVMLDFWGNW